jgi:sigma-B regulation protein RsbU (phosphoserine phosphatase)
VVIGDVTDKGMPAALFMASARSVVRANVAASDAPGQALERANAVLCAEAPNGMFVTLLLLRLSADGRIHFANAGNQRPLLYRGVTDDFIDLGAPGFPLGIFPDVSYPSAKEQLASGDFLLLYTDGLTDANNSNFSFFGRERLLAASREARRLPAQEMRTRLRLAVEGFIGATPPYDDVTFVLARRRRDDLPKLGASGSGSNPSCPASG